MPEVVITVATSLLLVGLALRADARLPRADRLPMQWSLSGAVNWTAPRRVALALIPTLGILMLTATTVGALFLEPRAGQKGEEVQAMLVLALVFTGSYLLHLELIEWTLRRR